MTTTEERKDALKWIDASLEHGRRCYKNSQMYCNFEPDVEKARKTVAILETIRASLSPSEPMGWQPISTAKKDGNEYLGWFPGLNERRVIWWCSAENFSAPLKNCAGGFWNSSHGSRHQPTQWTVLPAPPTVQAKSCTCCSDNGGCGDADDACSKCRHCPVCT